MSKLKTPNQVHITKRPDGWSIKSTGTTKPVAVLPTKTEAVDRGTKVAQNKHAELVIHGVDGKIQEKNSFGNDPNPPKDKK